MGERAWTSFVEAVRAHSSRSDAVALRYLSDGERESVTLTYAELDRRASSVAAWLAVNAGTGARVLVSGDAPDVAVGVLGTWYAGCVAVPAPPSEGHGAAAAERRRALITSGGCSAAVGDVRDLAGTMPTLVGDGATLQPTPWVPRTVASHELALVQFSSGTTAQPRGIEIEHRHLLANQRMIAEAFEHDEGTVVVGWLPLHHDMGLIGNLLQPLFVGGTAVLMPPTAFLRRPRRWLQAIARYRATTSGGPDFAYDLCVRRIGTDELGGVTLDSWRVAYNGAERIRPQTLDSFSARFAAHGFRRRAFYPCYGLAEATLFVSGGRVEEEPRVVEIGVSGSRVSCGRTWHGTDVRIVDPTTRAEVAEGEDGEIWVRGPAIARGYTAGANGDSFGAVMATGEGGFLRTGDLGRGTEHGLIITGRVKDVVIVRGRSVAAEDVEAAVEQAVEGIAASSTVAFSKMTPAGDRVTLVIELDRARTTDPQVPTQHARRAVAARTGVEVDDVVLVRAGAIPRTSSGKARRGVCRTALERGELVPWFRWSTEEAAARAGIGDVGERPESLAEREEVVRRALSPLVGAHAGDGAVRLDAPLADAGLDSVATVELGAAIEETFGVLLPPGMLQPASTFGSLVAEVAARWIAPAARRVAAVSDESSAELTAAERAVWVANRVDEPGSYTLVLAADLDGDVDLPRIAGALQRLVAQHPGLRTTFPDDDGEPRRCVAVAGHLDVAEHVVDTADRDGAIAALAAEPFDVARGPLFRARLLTGGPTTTLVLLAHHLILDLWSAGSLLHELSAALDLPRGPAPAVPTLAVPPSAFSPVVEELVELDAEDTRRLRALARQLHTTPFVVMTAATRRALARIPSAPRRLLVARAERHDAAAMRSIDQRAVVTAPRLSAAVAPDLSTEVSAAANALGPGADRDDVPSCADERAVLTWQVLRPGLNPALLPFLLGLPGSSVKLGSLRLTARPVSPAGLPFAISVILADLGSSVRGWIRTRGANPSVVMEEIQRALREPAADRRSLGARFEAVADRSPSRPAVSFGESRLTYRELDDAANRLASRLLGAGVKTEDTIGLLIDRSIETVIGILAILKCGAAYVPIDPDSPVAFQRRLARSVGLVVTRTSLAGALDAQLPTIYVDTDGGEQVHPAYRVDPANAAYVIHTSGSTGEPKGVVVTHGNVTRLIDHLLREVSATAEDVWSCFHAASFDFSVWEIWGALLSGGHLVILGNAERRDPTQLHAALSRHQVTVASFTPTVFRELERADALSATSSLPALRTVVFGGESVDLDAIGRWFNRHGDERPALINMYGITETTVHVTARRLRQADVTGGAASPIGRPIADLAAHVLDDSLRSPRHGTAGELYIGGAGVARCYLGRPDLTAERFVPDPFSMSPGARMYRTGDRASWTTDDELSYEGRLDHQVKIRGYRVELAAIESALVNHPAVAEAAVIYIAAEQTHPRQGDAHRAFRHGRREPSVIGFVRLAQGSDHEVAHVLSWLRDQVPAHMVPTRLAALDKLPRTTGDKLDRARLRELATALVPHRDRTRTFAGRTPEESAVADVWSDVLETSPVAPTDDFFGLGGDSIRALRVQSRLAGRGYRVSARDLFKHTVLADLAAHLTRDVSAPATAYRPFSLLPDGSKVADDPDVEDAYPLTRLQLGLLYHTQAAPDAALYREVFSYDVAGDFSPAAFEHAVARLSRRHPILRTTFDLGATPLQRVHHTSCVTTSTSAVEDASRVDEVSREVTGAMLTQPFTPSEPPLVRFHAVFAAGRRYRVVVCFHAALLDGWSVANLITELLIDHERLKTDPSAEPLAPPSGCFAEHVGAELRLLGDAAARQFWLDSVAGVEPTRVAPTPHGTPRVEVFPVEVPEPVSMALLDAAQRNGLSLKHLLFAVHVRVLSFLTGRTEIVTGVESHARPEGSEPDVLGLFLNTIPLRAAPRGTWLELARHMRDLEVEQTPYRGFPLAEIQRLAGTGDLFDVSVNYTSFHQLRELTGHPGARLVGGEGIERSHFALKVELNRDPFDDRLQLDLEIDVERIPPRRRAAIIEAYRRALEACASAPTEPAMLAELSSPDIRDHVPTTSATPTTRIEDVIIAQARRTPHAVAVSVGSHHLLYGELDQLSGQAAATLRARGIAREDVIGVLMPRSTHAVIAVVGILRAGAAFLLLDPEDPPQRIGTLIEQAKPKLVVTNVADLLTGPVASQRPLDTPSAGDLAYVVYTSGTAGIPKGVAGTHAAMLNRLRWQCETFPARAGDVVAYKTSPRFVDAIAEMLAPLCMGATLEVIDGDTVRDPAALIAQLSAARVTHLVAVPSLLRAMVESISRGAAAPMALRSIVSSGEPLTVALARDLARALPGAQVFNYYGTSEIAADVTWRSVSTLDLQGTGMVPAGQPLPGVRCHVLGPGLRPVPVGTVGELYVGGIAVARGYLQDAKATADRFVPEPFGVPGARMYRTGDLASIGEDGALHIHGRADRQVKVRGNRIELGEIEVVLGEHPAVTAAALSTRATVDGLVLRAHVEAADRAITPEILRDHLERRLPTYAVPPEIEVLPTLPRLPSGKLDRKALAERPLAPTAPSTTPISFAPATPSQAMVASVWQLVLGRPPRSADASFFREGGDSLSALRLVHALQDQVGARLPLPVFLAAPTVAAVAEWLAEQTVHPAAPAALRPDPDHRHEPFQLTDVQQAYWVGRSDELALGGVGSQLYLDVEAVVDPRRLEQALQALVSRHDMLRTVVREDGLQQTLAEPPPVTLPARDVADHELAEAIASNRGEMVNRVFDPARWPLFDVRVTRTPSGRTRIQLAIDLLIADAWSMRLLIHELMALHDALPIAPPSPLTFRDYVEQVRRKDAQPLESARSYWLARLDTLPRAPALPTRTPPRGTPRSFRRSSMRLAPDLWAVLRRRAHDANVTPAALLITLFAEALGLYAESRHFTLNLTLYDRQPVHPDVDRIVGDFTTLDLLEVDVRGPAPLAVRVAAVHRQLWADLEHRHAGGVQILRELTRRKPDRMSSMMPVVFTSTLGLGIDPHAGWLPDSLTLVESLTQTPQVTLDYQVREDRGALIIDWDHDAHRFPPGLIDELFAFHEALLRHVAGEEAAWREDAGAWLAKRAERTRDAAQHQIAAVSPTRLETGLLRSMELAPDAIAVIGEHSSLTYGELLAHAAGLAGRLSELGVTAGDRVGILLPHGVEAVVAVLGVLWSGGAYVPVDTGWPVARRNAVLARLQTIVIGDGSEVPSLPPHVRPVAVHERASAVSAPRCQRPDSLAYVMHTSGSTGEPKGVMMTHAAAWNTIAPLLSRWNIGASDAVLAVSALGFDLSVFDLFGLLGAGGRVVVPAGDGRRDPARWAALIRQHRVTIWNSVPALMELLLEHVDDDASAALGSLRLVLLSGDWVPVDLAARIQRAVGHAVEVVALGGATEAAIWSISQDATSIPEDATSVPYGRSLPNQRVHVLDEDLRERGTWAVGELYITGAGLALGYLDAPELTAARFVPRGSERAYRTGDLGCYRPDGSIELHGRRDGQVKIAGHRVELAEIERAMRACDGVADAVAVATGPLGSRRRLRGVVTPKGPSVDVERLRAELRRKLPEAMVPSDLAVVSALPLTATGKVDRGALASVELGQAPTTRSSGPSALVTRIASAVGDIIGHGTIDPDADLLAMGVTSIDAVRIANRLQRDLGFRPGLEQIYRRPTVTALAELAAEAHAEQELPLTRLDADPSARQGMVCAAALPNPIGAPIALPAGDAATAGTRRSERTFRSDPVSLVDLATVLSPLRRSSDGRYSYASAGGLYSVRAYVHVRPGSSTDLPGGLYVYEAGDHVLAPIATIDLDREIHEPFLNRAIFDQAAFSLFLAAKLDDARSIYGKPARDFCLIEAGAMAQLVATAAGATQLGLCPIGFLDFDPVRRAIDVGTDLELLHSFVGGVSVERARPEDPTEGPLTAAQRRIWFEQELRPENPAWNIVAAVRIAGSIDVELLGRALTEAQARHRALRATFHVTEAGPIQRISPPAPFDLRRLAFPEVDASERAGHAATKAAELGAVVIDLEHGPPSYAALLEYADDDHVLVIVVHHIVADGWSINLIVDDIITGYANAGGGQKSRASGPRPSVIEVALDEETERKTRRSAATALQWKARLADAPPLRIPGEHTRTGEPTFRGQLTSRSVPSGVTEALEALAVSEKASLFMVLVAAFELLCATRTGQRDIVVGLGTANRRRTELERTVGCFVNLVAVRTDLTACATPRDVLRAVRDRSLEALEGGNVAYDTVVESLQPVRSLGQTPWMRAALVMQTAPRVGDALPGLRLTPLVVDSGTARFDLTLFFVRMQDGQLSVRAQFATDVLPPAAVDDLLDAFEATLAALPIELDQPWPRRAPARGTLRSARAASVTLTAERVLRLQPAHPGTPDGPAIVSAQHSAELASTWLLHDRSWLLAELRRRGALLLRGLIAPSTSELRKFATAHEGLLIDDNGELPRQGLDVGIYGAVDYPPGEYILWHNENAFYRKAPARLWFQCQEAALEGGATPVVDGRQMLRRVPTTIIQELTRRGVMYVRRYADGLGLPWQEVFGTQDPRVVEARCAALGLSWTWSGDELETRSLRHAVIRHPLTGERCWFNQLTHWHPSCLPQESQAGLTSSGELTRDVTFGDGGAISADMIAEICGAYASLEIATSWRVGDILIIDNALMSHARRPYVGTRRLAIALGGTLDDEELAAT